MLQKSEDFEQGASGGHLPVVETVTTKEDDPVTDNPLVAEMSPLPEVQDDNHITLSESEDDESIEADDEDEDDYADLRRRVFKTSNRLVDDIAGSINFHISTNVPENLKNGILRLQPIEYAEKFSHLKYNQFDIYLPDQRGVNVAEGQFERYDSTFNPNDKITIIRGIIFSNAESTLSKLAVYHVRIAIKTKASTNVAVSKHEFHETELSYQDAVDLCHSTALADSDSPEIKERGPKLIDSASYVCLLTKKAMRIEISKPEFDELDLKDYELGPIRVRHHKAKQLYEDTPEKEPSPAQCLYTLYRVMKGPLIQAHSGENRTINVNNKSLNQFTNPDLLTRKLGFVIENDEYVPPRISDRSDRLQMLNRESFLRKTLEIMFLGTKAYSNQEENPFRKFASFTTRKDLIFRELEDYASVQHHKFVTDAAFITLSAYPFYSDDLIIDCYTRMCERDPQNIPRYFDALQSVSRTQGNLKLTRFTNNRGIVGQKDLDQAYTALRLDPRDGPKVDDAMLLSLYHTEKFANPHDGRFRNALGVIGKHRKSQSILRYLKYELLPIQQAYDILEITENTEDEMLATAELIKLESHPQDKELVTRAVLTIASARRSFSLMTRLENDHPDLTDEMSFAEACDFLAVDQAASESKAIEIFDNGRKLTDFIKGRKALSVFAGHRTARLIPHYLATGTIDHTALPAAEWPVGLMNIGNTCYLNSLLQYYFAIKPFRDTTTSFYDVYTGQDIYRNRRIGGRLIGDHEIDRSFQFVYHLRNLFSEMIHSPERCVIPQKSLQYLAFTPCLNKVDFDSADDSKNIEEEVKKGSDDDIEIVDAVPASPETDLIDLSEDANVSSIDDVIMVDDSEGASTAPETRTTSEVTEDNKDTMKEAEEEDLESVAPEPKAANVSKADFELALDMGRQQDVVECIENVLTQVSIASKPEGFDKDDQNEQQDFIKTLFFGKNVQHLVKTEDRSIVRDSTTRSTYIIVNINDNPKDLYEALDNVFLRPDLVDIGPDKFERNEKLLKLPKILQVQIQRVGYDPKLCQAFKNSTHLPIPETLYVDRYVDTNDPEILKRRADVLKWKEEINKLREERDWLLKRNSDGISFKESLKTTRDWLTSQGLGDTETTEVITKEIDAIDEKLMNLYNSINQLEFKIEHHFDDYKKEEYQLFALFIHRGTATSGHYWLYIKDHKRNMYRMYNDETVSDIKREEVFNYDPQNTATPYFVAYIRKEDEDDIDPVCRDIGEVH